MYSRSERRVFRRIEGEVPVRYTLSRGRREYRAVTKNISGGGMKISIFKRMAPGTILDLQILRDASGRNARCKGEVRWIGSAVIKGKRKKALEAGIKFLDLSFLFIGNLIGDLESKKIAAQLKNPTTN